MEPRHSARLADSRVYVAALSLAWLYFIAMDVVEYVHIVRSPVRKVQAAATTAVAASSDAEQFSLFADVAVKTTMEDHLTAYGLWPLAVHFDLATGFSAMGRLVTPNAVSFTGAVLAVPAARLTASSSLAVRRAGVALFLFRLWLDALDGIVFRRQHFTGASAHHQMSVRGSSGYFVDAICDFFTGICLLVAFYVLLTREPRPRHVGLLPSPCAAAERWLAVTGSCLRRLACGWCGRRRDGATAGGGGFAGPARDDDGGDPLLPTSGKPSTTAKHVQQQASKYSITLKLVVTALLMALSSATWDYFVSQYRDCLEKPYADAKLQNLQHQLLSSPLTYMIFFAWKMFNAVELMNMAFYAVLIDRVWEYVNLMQCAGVVCWIVTVIVTKLHVSYPPVGFLSLAVSCHLDFTVVFFRPRKRQDLAYFGKLTSTASCLPPPTHREAKVQTPTHAAPIHLHTWLVAVLMPAARTRYRQVKTAGCRPDLASFFLTNFK